MDALTLVITVAALASAFALIASWVTRDTSWVDRLWSIVPVVYLWIFAGEAGLNNARLTVMAVLVTAWGVRLTFNFARKGGYSGTEDYRWAILRARMKPWQFQVFNLLFIVGYQMTLLVLLVLPAQSVAVLGAAAKPLGPLDGLAIALFLLLLAGETIADQQQWRFHQHKQAAREAGRTLEPPFLTTGLFAYSRHPNYFFEIAQWWVLYLFAVAASGQLLHWSVLGAVLLTGLFIGSTVFTESISASKYPDYARYQRQTSAIVPWPGRRRRTAPAEAESH